MEQIGGIVFSIIVIGILATVVMVTVRSLAVGRRRGTALVANSVVSSSLEVRASSDFWSDWIREHPIELEHAELRGSFTLAVEAEALSCWSGPSDRPERFAALPWAVVTAVDFGSWPGAGQAVRIRFRGGEDRDVELHAIPRAMTFTRDNPIAAAIDRFVADADERIRAQTDD